MDWLVANMRKTSNTYRILMGKPLRKRPLRSLRRKLEDNIKVDLKEDRRGMELAQDRTLLLEGQFRSHNQ
jgi:hypothetical protein